MSITVFTHARIIDPSRGMDETGAVIVTLILLGRFLEAKAKTRMSDSIRKLMDLAPKYAWLIADGAEREVPVSSLRVGDLVRVKPG